MERLRYRSTSVADLQAELRQRDLLEGADRVQRRRPMPRTRGTVFGRMIGRWRLDRNGA